MLEPRARPSCLRLSLSRSTKMASYKCKSALEWASGREARVHLRASWLFIMDRHHDGSRSSILFVPRMPEQPASRVFGGAAQLGTRGGSERGGAACPLMKRSSSTSSGLSAPVSNHEPPASRVPGALSPRPGGAGEANRRGH